MIEATSIRPTIRRVTSELLKHKTGSELLLSKVESAARMRYEGEAELKFLSKE